jgi:hypothetical protein
MDLKATIDIILKDLKDARDIMDDLKNYPDVPEIQIELAKAKCQSAEQVLKFFTEKDLLKREQTEIKRDVEPEEDHKLATEKEKAIEIETKNNIGIFELSDLDEDITETIAPEITDAHDEDPGIIDQIVQAETSKAYVDKNKDIKQKGQILADKFSSQSSINEQIGHKRHDTESAEVSKLKPVINLSDAIGINDRFQYVRELFNGNQDLCNTTIEKLNIAKSMDEAFDILSLSAQADSDRNTFDLLLGLVKRKLTSS